MKRRLSFCLFSLLFTVSLASPVCAGESQSTPVHLNSLWRVEGKSNVVYLLGSIHVLKPSDHPLATSIESAFSNAQVVVFETDIGKMEEPDTQLKMMSKASLPEGQTLKQQLSPQVYVDFSNHLHAAGLPAIVFDNLKPAMAGVGLFMMKLQEMGVDPEYGVDRYFYKKARKDGKQMIPLETVDFQIDMLADLSKEEGELLVKSILKEMDELGKEYNELLNAWKTGDSVELSKLLDRSMRESPELYKRLVVERSRKWMPRVEELLGGNKNAIVIVGAGHLVGNEGVVEMLKKKGFKVKQL